MRLFMRVLIASLAIAGASALLLLLAGPGVRLDLWTYGRGFQLMRWAAYGGLAGLAVAIVGLGGLVVRGSVTGRAVALGTLAILLGAGTAWVPWSWVQKARSVPPIHDITTDTENPPRFDAVLPRRADAPNPAEYGGPEIAKQQREAYPDIGPLRINIPIDTAFHRALSAAREMGWEVVATNRDAGRIEATATTTWFGFKDDVVIRVQAADGGSRIDVRSVSRVGRSDVGKNAERIRAYLERLREMG